MVMVNPDKDLSAITAALILIGNELLSGRTRDANLNYLAQRLNEVGISLVEARVIPDVEETIISHVNELRRRATYVFTTGGIGPTHDDITAESVAKAFDVPLIRHPEAERRLLQYFTTRGVEVNEARLRMANTPQGAELIANQISVAPGFFIDNVYVMAGVPKVMQVMVDEILPRLQHRAPITSATVVCDLPEGTVAMGLREIQLKFAELSIGSYPGRANTGYRVSLVVRGANSERVTAAAADIESLVRDLGGHIERD